MVCTRPHRVCGPDTGFPGPSPQARQRGGGGPLPRGLSGTGLTLGSSRSPGNGFLTTALLSPHGNKARAPVSRETQPSASQ